MKLAAIDIGSNAARLQISKVLYHNGKVTLKKIEYVRFPLRLGYDVFKIQKISKEREQNLLKLLQSYKLLMELHEVTDYLILATSAMREASNGVMIAEKVEAQLGLKIQIIDGEEEAAYINRAIVDSLDEKRYLHIDVGGGSTELNFYQGKVKLCAKSFKIGSIRLLEHAEPAQEFQNMKEWIEKYVKPARQKVIAIGTGGNIQKLASMVPAKKKKKPVSLQDLKTQHDYLATFSLAERINILELNEDRADVIIPASEIYILVMEWAHAKEILVPDVGLKDGMILSLLEKKLVAT